MWTRTCKLHGPSNNGSKVQTSGIVLAFNPGIRKRKEELKEGRRIEAGEDEQAQAHVRRVEVAAGVDQHSTRSSTCDLGLSVHCIIYRVGIHSHCELQTINCVSPDGRSCICRRCGPCVKSWSAPSDIAPLSRACKRVAQQHHLHVLRQIDFTSDLTGSISK